MKNDENKSKPVKVRLRPVVDIRLNGTDYDVKKGAGVYLGPGESAMLSAGATASAKLFHLIVPQIPKL